MRGTWVQSLGWGRSPGERKGYPPQYSGLENVMDCIVMGSKESDTTEPLSPFTFCLPPPPQKALCFHPKGWIINNLSRDDRTKEKDILWPGRVPRCPIVPWAGQRGSMLSSRPAQLPHLPASQVLAQPRARCIAKGKCRCLQLRVYSSVEGGQDLVWFLNFSNSVLSLEIRGLVTFTALTLGHTAGKKKRL